MSDYRTMQAALREIAANSADPASRRLAAAAVKPARTKTAQATTCSVCGAATERGRRFCCRDHARQFTRQKRHRANPAVYARYFEALRLRSDGKSFTDIGRQFGVGPSRGVGLVWAAARVLSRPENAGCPEQVLMKKVVDAGLIDVARLREAYGTLPMFAAG